MSEPRWSFDLVTAGGVSLMSGGLQEPASVTVQRGAPAVWSTVLDLDTEAAERALAAEGAVWVKGYRSSSADMSDSILRFYGPLWVDELIGSADDGDTLALTAMDPLVTLSKRWTDAQYAATDQGLVIKAMVDDTNTDDGETGIRTNGANVTATTVIDLDLRTNLPTIETIIGQLQDQLDGCEVWVEPIELSSGKIGDLYVARQRGVTNTDVVFAYGDGTLGNCLGMTRARSKSNIENDTYGSTDTEGIAVQRAQDAASIAALGRLVGRTAFTGETNAAVLLARTQGRINRLSSMARVSEYVVTTGDNAPRLFDDFEVGDTVRLHFRSGRVEWEADQRVHTASVSTDAEGFEELTDLGFGGVVV